MRDRAYLDVRVGDSSHWISTKHGPWYGVFVRITRAVYHGFICFKDRD